MIAASSHVDTATAATMRAAVFTGSGQSRLKRVPLPVPGPGEARVRLEGCGVCASNLLPWEGSPWTAYPLAPGAPGHEGWGWIDALGEGAATVTVGQRVAFLSSHGFAEYDITSTDGLVPLPAALDGQAVPGEPLGCAFNIYRRCAITAGQSVAIVGAGFLGALLCRLAANAGARVVAVSRRPFSLDVARSFGASETVMMDDHQRIIERVKALTDGAGCAVVVEAVGKQWPLDLAAELTRERGRLVIAGYHQDGPRQVNMQLWNWRGLDVINAHERDPRVYLEGMREAVAALESGALDPTPLYTHRYPLERLDDALAATRDRPEGFMKALVTL